MKQLEKIVHSFEVLRIGEDSKGVPFAEIRTPDGIKKRLYVGDRYNVVVNVDD